MSNAPSEDFDVDVHTRLPREVFKRYNRVAAAQRTTVGMLLRAVAIRAIEQKPTPRPRGPRVEWSEADLDRLRSLHSEGLTDNQIGQRMGRPFWAVSYQRNKVLGLPSNGKKFGA